MNCEDTHPFIYTIKRSKSIGCFVLVYKLITRGNHLYENNVTNFNDCS